MEALFRSLLATLFRPIVLPPLMCVEVPKFSRLPLSLPGLGSAFNLTALGVVCGGFPFSLVVGSPEYTSQCVKLEPRSGEPVLGLFQNLRVFLATGMLLLNLPDVKTGDRLARGLGESDTGETSGLSLLFRPLST